MSNKTISINPLLFNLGVSRSKKKRDKKPNPISLPVISPNVLKNKLLKRIKEHKQRETQHLGNNNKKNTPKIENIEPSKNNEMLNYSDEFNDSINYLQTLSKQKQKEELERKTIKNYNSLGGQDLQHPIINIDLPDELLQATIKQPLITEPYNINTYYKGDSIPYGIIKGGIKPSYKDWSRTQRNNIVTNPNSSLIIDGGILSSHQSTRENRLNLLKEKIKEKIKQKEVSEKTDPLLNEMLIKKPISSEILIPTPSIQPVTPPGIIVEQKLQQTQPNQSVNEPIIAMKHITKKTIKRKYTLGKSETKRRVSVLIKDRGTQKKILTAQKDLKRKNMPEIKEYLRHHNLIKIGSNAPNDVLRKLYESAMLSGEITNRNSNILLHNCITDF